MTHVLEVDEVGMISGERRGFDVIEKSSSGLKPGTLNIN